MGIVYFVRLKGLHPIKIAYTNGSINEIMRKLNRDFPFGCSLLHSFTSKNPKEDCIKLRVIFRNEKFNGDWFNITEEDIENVVHSGDVKDVNNEYYNFEEDIVLKWLNNNVSVSGNERLYRNDLFDSFVKESGEVNISQKVFKLKIDQFIELCGFIPVSKRDQKGRYTLARKKAWK